MDSYRKSWNIGADGVEVQMEVESKIADLLITPDVLRLIRDVDACKGAWRAIGRIAPERSSYLAGLRPSRAPRRLRELKGQN